MSLLTTIYTDKCDAKPFPTNFLEPVTERRMIVACSFEQPMVFQNRFISGLIHLKTEFASCKNTGTDITLFTNLSFWGSIVLPFLFVL